MREIDEKAIKFIAKNNIVVLRSAITGVALNVSYTEFGVSWTTDKNGLSLYYKRDESGTLNEKSDRVVVEKFVPRNHNSPALQAAEFLAIKKAYKLLYPAGNYRREQGDVSYT